MNSCRAACNKKIDKLLRCFLGFIAGTSGQGSLMCAHLKDFHAGVTNYFETGYVLPWVTNFDTRLHLFTNYRSFEQKYFFRKCLSLAMFLNSGKKIHINVLPFISINICKCLHYQMITSTIFLQYHNIPSLLRYFSYSRTVQWKLSLAQSGLGCSVLACFLLRISFFPSRKLKWYSP